MAVLTLLAVLWCLQNVVLYAGSAEDRRIIREHEWFYPRHKVTWPAQLMPLYNRAGCVYLNVLQLCTCHQPPAFG